MTALCRFELPESFVRRFGPLAVHAHESGIRRYVFDPLGFEFYRRLSVSPVDPAVIWSVVRTDNGFALLAGHHDSGIGVVVTRSPAPSPLRIDLAARLTYRQRLRRSMLRGLLSELLGESFNTPAEMLAYIARSADVDWMPT